MTKLNIVADVAGEYETLMALIKKMPEADKIILLGDCCDRGPDSKKVIEFAMNTKNLESIKGNHEQLFIDAYRTNDTEIWFYNGGFQTVNSYGGALEMVPKEHIDWLDSRPLYLIFDDLILSHAPIESMIGLPNPFSRNKKHIACEEDNFIWNRYEPTKPLGLNGREYFHIHGHNSSFKQFKTPNGETYCICLDNSSRKELCGIHWESKENYQLFTHEYIR